MRLNRNLRIGLALIGAAFLVWAVSRIFGSRSTQTTNTNIAGNSAPSTRNVVEPVVLSIGEQRYVALEDIPERTIITRDMFAIEPLPRDAPRNAYVTDMASQGQGFITRNRIAMRSSLRPSDLIGHISDVGVAGALRPGLRAMVVPITNKPTLHDLVHVGDYVDVIAAFDQQEARTIVQNVRVLAVDVFGKNMVRMAARGDYKAETRGISTANPGSPTGTVSGTTRQVGQGDGAAPGAAPVATPAATPTPAPNGQPPAKPEPAITLEVTPDQATALSLSQASNAPLDFILRPRPTEAVLPETRVAASIKPRLAPFATQVKNRAAGNTSRGSANTTTSRNSGTRNAGTRSAATRDADAGPIRRTRPVRSDSPDFGSNSDSRPLQPFPVPDNPGGMGAPPTRSAPEKYEIPVYGEGKLIKSYPVEKPAP